MRHILFAIAAPSALAAAIACASAPRAHAAPQSAPKYLSAGLPPSMQRLAAKIQGKKPGTVRQIITRQLGPPTRDVGSGLSIPQWDASGGVLTFHPLRGASFKRGGHTSWLIATRNPLMANLLGSYSMSSMEGQGSISYWLGALEIRPGLTYRYASGPYSEADLPPSIRRASYFFRQHSKGRVRIILAEAFKATTLLETVPRHATVAQILFVASDGASQDFPIVSDADERSLAFKGAAQNFEMAKSWDNFWN